jgi:hypothetical protein
MTLNSRRLALNDADTIRDRKRGAQVGVALDPLPWAQVLTVKLEHVKGDQAQLRGRGAVAPQSGPTDRVEVLDSVAVALGERDQLGVKHRGDRGAGEVLQQITQPSRQAGPVPRPGTDAGGPIDRYQKAKTVPLRLHHPPLAGRPPGGGAAQHRYRHHHKHQGYATMPRREPAAGGCRGLGK